MSVGPLWLLRRPAQTASLPAAAAESLPAAALAAPVTAAAEWPTPGTPAAEWRQTVATAASAERQPAAVSDLPLLLVTAQALSDTQQQSLLQHCLRAGGWPADTPLLLLAAQQSAAAVQQLASQVQLLAPASLLILGQPAAALQEQLAALGWSGKVLVTHHPAEMLAQPGLKAQVWADLCRLRFGPWS